MRSLDGLEPSTHLDPRLGTQPLKGVAIPKLERHEPSIFDASVGSLDLHADLLLHPARPDGAYLDARQKVELDFRDEAGGLGPPHDEHVRKELRVPVLPGVVRQAVDVVVPERRLIDGLQRINQSKTS